MKLALAADHAGYPLKQHLLDYLRKQGHEALDLGVDTPDIPADYPDIASLVAHAVLDGRAERGILVCGSGIGACIAANKFKGIYASIAHDTYSAAQGVVHDHMNVLCVGSRVIGTVIGESVADAFINAVPSQEERFIRRLNKMKALES